MERMITENGGLSFREAQTEILSIQSQWQQDTVFVTLRGRLQQSVFVGVLDELRAFSAAKCHVVLDLEKLDAISSAGMNALRLLQEEMDSRALGQTLQIKNVQHAVYQQMTGCGLHAILDIEPLPQ